MKLNSIILIFVTCLSSAVSVANDVTQTVRGTIIDQDTRSPLIGATVQIDGTDPIVGTITDVNGEFRLSDVILGRISLVVSYIGYDQKVVSNLIVNSAKETVVEVQLIESVEKLSEIVVSASAEKPEILNEMSLVSSRTFSVEETKRYAGSFADPARMVSSYAGVTNDPEGNNDIVVRGNSPRGILWKLEGIEIPNPNHFANEGATGGPINALNPNMLSNSDFMTGAFAPEYGNALSGVFDVRFKKGNNQKREYTAGISTLGVDFTMEGPFSKGYNGSYLLNYRYSSLALISGLGVIDFGGIPKYQDLSFNINLPFDKRHSIGMFGLGGLSSISTEYRSEATDLLGLTETFSADMGTVGVTHHFLLTDNTYIKSTLAASGTRLIYQQEDYLPDATHRTAVDADFGKSFVRGLTTVNHKFNAQHKLETGVIYTKLGYNLQEWYRNDDTDVLEKIVDGKGDSYTLQAFSTWKYRIHSDLTFVGGFHYLFFGLNNTYILEPRGALEWKVAEGKSLSFGIGMHSRLESLGVYLGKEPQDDGTLLQHNKQLEMSKAVHYALGYDQGLGPWLHGKIEVYYQHLYNVPIENVANSTFSMLNSAEDFTLVPLVNQGTGKNYGLELTLERYLHNDLYFLTTASLYQSLYTAQDGIERNTAFAGNYTFNVLAGKEWKYGTANKQKTFFLNLKATLLGAKPYTPIDLAESIEKGHEVRDEDRPYALREADIFILNMSVGTRKNKKNTTQEFKIDLQNATAQNAAVDVYYFDDTQKIEKAPQLPFFPTISYSISF